MTTPEGPARSSGPAASSSDDSASPERNLTGIWGQLVTLLAFGLGMFHLYTAGFGQLPNIMQRGTHLGLALALTFAVYSARKRTDENRIPVWDLLLMILSLLITVHLLTGYDRIIESAADSLTIDIVYGTLLVLLILEAARRSVGLVFPILVGITLLYTFLGQYLSGIWAHGGYRFRMVVELLFMTTNGVWGEVIAVSATIIAVFVILGSVLLHCGGGQTFIDLSIILAGRLRGGAAKVAVISSSLVATINGSGPANVATTGSLTIPMMKRLGYKPELAAATEAVASTGGQIAPPVMGAGAFIMAELINVPYSYVAMSAVLPAFLYYLGAWFSVDFLVRRQGLKPVDIKDIPRLREVLTWRRCAPLFLPLGLLLWAIFAGYALPMAGFLGIVSALGLYLLTGGPIAEIRERGIHCLRGITAGGKGIVNVAAVTAAAQIIISLINITGLAPKLSSFVVAFSGGSLMLALVLTMVVALILGMGMPTVGAYILTVTIAGGALMTVGLDKLPAHLFIFYFAVISGITPPVCTSVYVASALAGSNWLRTGLLSVGMGVSGFIVPYAFVAFPGLLMQGTIWDILPALFTASLGVIAMAAAVSGYFVRLTPLWQRALLVASGLMLIDPNGFTDVVGLLLWVGVWAWQMYLHRQERSVAEQEVSSATR